MGVLRLSKVLEIFAWMHCNRLFTRRADPRLPAGCYGNLIVNVERGQSRPKLASNQALPALDTSHARCCYWRRLLGKGSFEGCADSDNLVTMEVFGNVSTKRLSMPHDQQMARYLRRFEHQQQSQGWAKMQVSVGLWMRMYGYSSLHTNAKARESSKNT